MKNTILGYAGEDKRDLSGIPQAIAAMVTMTINLALKAICRKTFLTRSIVYGFQRIIPSNEVLPMQLDINYVERTTRVFQGKRNMDVSTFLKSIRYLLSYPEKIIQVTG